MAFIGSRFAIETFLPQQVLAVAGTVRAALAVTLAALGGALVVVARRRWVESPMRWPSAIRLGILTFFAVLVALCVVDACLIGFQQAALRKRIAGDSLSVQRVLGRGDDRQPKVER